MPCQDLLRNGDAILRAINPDATVVGANANNCPAVAAAVFEYLNTGDPLPAVNANNARYIVTGNFQRTPLERIIADLISRGNCAHVVVLGTRSAQSSLYRTHYFNMVNIGNRIYVVDAYTHEITDRILRIPSQHGPSPSDINREPFYLNRQELSPNRLDVSRTFSARPRP